MKIVAGTIAGIVLVSTAAFAGGNPDEEQDGFMTRQQIERAEEAGEIKVFREIPDQHEIQRRVEAEIFAKPQLQPVIVDEPAEEPITIARTEPVAECVAIFEWFAKQLGGECFRDSNFHNPSPVGYTTVREVTEETRVERKKRSFHKTRKGYRAAKHFAHKLHKQGFKVRIGFRKGKIKVVGKKTVTFDVVTLTQVRNDKLDNGNSGGMSGGDTGRERDEHGPESNY